MSLITYNQLRNLMGVDSDFDSAVRAYFDSGPTFCASCAVNMDLIREGNSFKIMAELPGMEKDKIKIMVENDVLTISGERQRPEAKENEVIRAERFFGNFSRSFSLPDSIDKSGISADYKNGVLEVILPLIEEVKPRQIDIKVN